MPQLPATCQLFDEQSQLAVHWYLHVALDALPEDDFFDEDELDECDFDEPYEAISTHC